MRSAKRAILRPRKTNNAVKGRSLMKNVAIFKNAVKSTQKEIIAEKVELVSTSPTMIKRKVPEEKKNNENSVDSVIPSIIADEKSSDRKNRGRSVRFNSTSQVSLSHVQRTLNFNEDILKLAGHAQQNRIRSKIEKDQFGLSEIDADKHTFQKVKVLRYRENVFRAAGRLTHDLPPFPNWIYRDKRGKNLETLDFIVGGTRYKSFENTIVNIPNTKLATCIVEHSGDPVIFFDRDPDCFNCVLNFYRTGRLHAPSNSCLSFFEEELEFWGINEEYMEPCCYSEYQAYRTACKTLKKFSESKDKTVHTDLNKENKMRLQMKLYSAIVVGDNTITSMWYSTICGTCIVVAILILFFGTSPYGRVDIDTNQYRPYQQNETILYYFAKTSIMNKLSMAELILSGYFITDIVTRLLICPNYFTFFTETINWVDILATCSSFISVLVYDKNFSGHDEAYVIILKIPRIFRLFKLTANLKSGLDAFILTLRASINELLLVFLIVVIFVCIFGVLIFVVELVNENDVPSKFKSIYIGMWWAMVTMTTVGYGDYVPATQGGYVVGCFCIICGIIICQLPVPIFLKNFSIYYNQAYARIDHETRVLTASIDPENLADSLKNKDVKSVLCKEDLLKLKRFAVAT